MSQGLEKTILYIEDNQANSRLMQRLVSSKTPYKLITSGDASLGLQLARENQPDLILLDINLPGMDGYETMEQLKNSSQTQDIPVVAISAAAMERDLLKGKKAGFKKYLTKPVDINILLATIDDYLNTATMNL